MGSIFLSLANCVLAAGYVLGPGDELSVIVLRHPEISADQTVISAAGRINLPVAGEIVATGKTLEQLDQEITRRLRVRLLRPEVTVVLRQARPRQVFVYGAVAKSGAYELKPGWRVTEALTLAGGLTAKPELVGLSLTRDNKTLPLSLEQILADSSGAENRILQPGDTLRFSERTMQVSVTGSVVRSGAVEVPVGSRIVYALALAGGPTPKALLSKATVKRADGTNVDVNLYKASVLGDEANNIPLQAGDLLYIPESDARVTVLGAVQKPGLLDIKEGDTFNVADAIGLAGGPGPRAALTRATVRRADGSVANVDLYKILVQGDQTGNVQLAAGDVVVIPESRGVTVLGAVKNPGTYNVAEGSQPRVSDVLALAGGLSIPPESARISIARSPVNRVETTTDPNATTDPNPPNPVRPDGEASGGRVSGGLSAGIVVSNGTASRVNAMTLLDLSDPAQNERVQDGDLITVSAEKSQTVFVSGEVKTPGAFELKEGDGVAELIARAGGATPLAALRKVSVVERDGTVNTLDVLAATRDGLQKFNFPLKEGDYVVVPKNEALVLVFPAVKDPGYYPVPEDKPLTLGEAIALAGGPKDRAQLKQVAILRQTPKGVQQNIVSLDKIYNGQLAVNTTLQSGDVVYVPEGRTTPSTFDNVTRALSSLSILRLF